jgi:hypothetical protein
VSATTIVRKARLTARKLDLADFEKWLIRESEGYVGIANNDIPQYRQINVIPRFWNPYNGWCPILIDDPLLYDLCHTARLTETIDEVEALFQSDGKLTVSYNNELLKILRSNMDMNFEIRGFIDRAALVGIINAVKNTILDWAVDLEKAGVLGEGIGFSKEDKLEAASVTQHIYAQNIGNFGNVSGASTVTANTSNSTFFARDVKKYVQQIRDAIPALPQSLQRPIEAELSAIEDSAGDEKKIKSHFQSIRNICEGAAGNLAASGIIGLIASIG